MNLIHDVQLRNDQLNATEFSILVVSDKLSLTLAVPNYVPLTLFGWYMFKYLPFGLPSSQDGFLCQTCFIISMELKLLIWGENDEQHDNRLK